MRQFVKIILAVFVLFLFSVPEGHADYCWSSQGGNGSSWMEVTVTAGGTVAKDIQVSLEASNWQCGYGYAYETQCTDKNGVARFKKQSSPSTECYSTYSYGGSSYTYCNWKSAHCYQECYESENNSYSGCGHQSFSKEGYRVRATPAWGSKLNDRFGQTSVDDIDIDFSNLQAHAISLEEKSNILRVRIQDDSGAAVASGLTLYVSGNSYYSNSESLGASFRDFYVVPGTYYVSAWCTNWQLCDYSCITSQNITIEKGDAIKEVIIYAKKNNSVMRGVVIGSDGIPLKDAYVSMNSYSSSANSCYSYGYDQANSDGQYVIRVPAGNYTVWVSPPYNYDSSSGSSTTPYASQQFSITLEASQSLAKNIVLERKDSFVAGFVKDGYGAGLNHSYVSGWRYEEGQNDWFSASSNADGSYRAQALKGRYNMSAYYWDSSDYRNSRISNCSNEGMVTIQAPASAVNFTFSVLDHNLKIVPIDEQGNTVSDFHGGASIRHQTEGEYNWCSRWVCLDGSGCGTTSIESNSKLKAEVYSWGMGSGYDPVKTSINFTTGGVDGLTVLEIPVSKVDSKITGSIVDLAGNKVRGINTCYSIYATRDNLWRYCSFSASESTYECKVSSGKWCVNYRGDWYSGYGTFSPGAMTKCIDVPAGGTQTVDLVVLKAAYINVTAKDNQGKAVRTWVEASPTSAGDENSTGEQWKYYNRGCYTDTNGKCQIGIGSNDTGVTYYLTAYRSWYDLQNDDITLPEEIPVTVKSGETVDASPLIFRKFDGILAIQAVIGSAATKTAKGLMKANPVINSDKSLNEEILEGVWVSCSSSLGGYSEVSTDADGKAELKCVSGDEWNCVGVNQVGSDLYISENAAATCVPLPEKTTVSIKMNLATTTPPTITQSWNAADSNSIKLSDNFSVSWPAASLADSGEVTCTIAADPFVAYQSNKRAACMYGHDVTCKDADGNAITQLKSAVTICTPLCEDQLENIDLDSKDLQFAYFDTATGSYRNLDEVTINADEKLVCGKSDHFTEFVLVGNGNKNGLDGDKENAEEESDRTGEVGSGSGVGGGGGGCDLVLNSKGPLFPFFSILLAFVAWQVGRRGFCLSLPRKTCPRKF